MIHLLRASADYAKNVMTYIENTDDVTISVFCKNLSSIINCCAKVNFTETVFEDKIFYLLKLLNSLLVDISTYNATSDISELKEYTDNVSGGSFLLNKSSRWNVQQLSEQCRRGGYKVAPKPNTNNNLKRLKESQNWLELLITILSTVNAFVAQTQQPLNEEQFEDLVVDVTMKLKYNYQFIKCMSTPCTQKILSSFDELLQLLTDKFPENQLICYLCGRASVEDVNDLYRTSKCECYPSSSCRFFPKYRSSCRFQNFSEI